MGWLLALKQTSFRVERRPCAYPPCSLCSSPLQFHWFRGTFSDFFPQVVMFQPHPSTHGLSLKILKKKNPFVWLISVCLTRIILLPIFFTSNIFMLHLACFLGPFSFAMTCHLSLNGLSKKLIYFLQCWKLLNPRLRNSVW